MNKKILSILVILEIIGIIFPNIQLHAKENEEILSKLKIGAFVSYTPKTNSSKYILPAKYTGAEEEQEILVEDLKNWRILNINEEAGTIDLVSCNSTMDITFQGAQRLQ